MEVAQIQEQIGARGAVTPDEIRVGATYRCVGGWERRVVAIEETQRGYTEVRYEARKPGTDFKRQPWNPLQWFADQVICEITRN